MIIDPKGRYGKFLYLGIQTNVDNIEADILFKARAWAPKNCKSFTIKGFKHTDYHGHSVDEPTGYGNFNVYYYTTLKEGEILLTSD